LTQIKANLAKIKTRFWCRVSEVEYDGQPTEGKAASIHS
jgi:hypothetical protein